MIPAEGLFLIVFLVAGYVAAVRISGEREAILRRTAAVVAANVVAYFLRHWLSVSVDSDLEFHQFLTSILRTVTIIGILYLGPIAYSLRKSQRVVCIHLVPLISLPSLRTVVIAPVAEELFFRGVVLDFLVYSQWDRRTAAVLSSVFFGLAHCHHIYDLSVSRENALRSAGYVAMTSAFGLLASWFRLTEKTIMSPIIAHSMANFFGAPDFQTMRNDTHNRFYAILTVTGIICFVIQVWYRS